MERFNLLHPGEAKIALNRSGEGGRMSSAEIDRDITGNLVLFRKEGHGGSGG